MGCPIFRQTHFLLPKLWLGKSLQCCFCLKFQNFVRHTIEHQNHASSHPSPPPLVQAAKPAARFLSVWPSVMRFAFSILLFPLAASLREKDASDVSHVSHVSLSEPDGVPQVMENGGFTETWMCRGMMEMFRRYNMEIYGYIMLYCRDMMDATIIITTNNKTTVFVNGRYLPPYSPQMVLHHVKLWNKR